METQNQTDCVSGYGCENHYTLIMIKYSSPSISLHLIRRFIKQPSFGCFLCWKFETNTVKIILVKHSRYRKYDEISCH